MCSLHKVCTCDVLYLLHDPEGWAPEAPAHRRRASSEAQPLPLSSYLIRQTHTSVWIRVIFPRKGIFYEEGKSKPAGAARCAWALLGSWEGGDLQGQRASEPLSCLLPRAHCQLRLLPGSDAATQLPPWQQGAEAAKSLVCVRGRKKRLNKISFTHKLNI